MESVKRLEQEETHTTQAVPVEDAFGSAHALGSQPYTHAYWLSHCEGFRVELPGEILGYVEDVRGDEMGGDEPVMLAVRERGHAGRLLHVPVEAVTAIVPSQERVYVNREQLPGAPSASRSEPGEAGLPTGSGSPA